jgi:ssDNA-binding Zn-finger/Zn-ribbon topoisomerase 1
MKKATLFSAYAAFAFHFAFFGCDSAPSAQGSGATKASPAPTLALECKVCPECRNNHQMIAEATTKGFEEPRVQLVGERVSLEELHANGSAYDHLIRTFDTRIAVWPRV